MNIVQFLWSKLIELCGVIEGRCHVVAAAMKRFALRKKLDGEKLKTVDKSADYILNDKEYMRYNEYLAADLPIASGIIEGACKHLVQDRFEISGARWGLERAEALLKLRAVYQSRDWDNYWKFHISRDQERLYPVRRWSPLNNGNGISKLTVIRG